MRARMMGNIVYIVDRGSVLKITDPLNFVYKEVELNGRYIRWTEVR